MRGVLGKKIQREELETGDHIYTLRGADRKVHHGIYVGDGIGREVIHLVRGEDPIIPSSSSLSHSHPSDSSVSTGDDGNLPTLPHYCRVEYCSIDSLVDGGELNLYKYGVDFTFLMAKTRGGTCTHIKTDPPKEVVYRARYLQKNNRFGPYNLSNNNCEDFAIFCKTLIVSPEEYFFNIGRNGQIASIIAILFAIVTPFSFFHKEYSITIDWKGHIPRFLFLKNNNTAVDMKALITFLLAFFYNDFIGAATTVYINYCGWRSIADSTFVTKTFRVPVKRMNPNSRLADWFESNFCHFILSSLE